MEHDWDEAGKCRGCRLWRNAVTEVRGCGDRVPVGKDVAPAVVSLGAVCLRLGEVERITYHPDGERKETVTDHTVMLGVIACALAAAHFPHLDVGKVAQYALVHDLPEAYAGDTPTLRVLSTDERDAKEVREQLAADRIERESRALPWVAGTMRAYESLRSPEARFVKVVDKFLPKVTHLLNGAVTLAEQGVGVEELEERLWIQRAELVILSAGFGEVLVLFDALRDELLALLALKQSLHAHPFVEGALGDAAHRPSGPSSDHNVDLRPHCEVVDGPCPGNAAGVICTWSCGSDSEDRPAWMGERTRDILGNQP